MKTLLEHMQAHHGRCDQLYADGENFLLDEQIEEGLESIKSFLNEMERHFQMEETVLFPTFEEISGMRQGCSFPPSKKSAACVRAQPR